MRLIFAAAVALLVPCHALQAELGVTFESQRVVVRGVSPGGSVAFLGIEKHPGYYRAEVVYRRELLNDSDADGVLSYRVERDIPSTSVWAFVDVATGSFVVATPEAGVMDEVEFPLAGSLRNEDGGIVLVDDRRAALELLYTRPRVGAWHQTASDGGLLDRDGGPDGRVRAHLGDLRRLGGGSGRITNALPGDLLIGIDRRKGEFFVHRIDGRAGR